MSFTGTVMVSRVLDPHAKKGGSEHVPSAVAVVAATAAEAPEVSFYHLRVRSETRHTVTACIRTLSPYA